MQTIGRLGTITVDEARAKARELLSRTTLGEDVAQELREGLQADTVAELATLFLAARLGKIKPSTHVEYARLFNVEILPVHGLSSARDVSPRDVARLHEARSGKPYLANRVVALLGALYSWARKVGYVAENVQPTRRVELYAETSRERYLTEADMLRLGASLRTAETVGVPPDAKRTAYLAKREAERAKRPYKRKFKKPRSARGANAPKLAPSNPYAIVPIRFLLLTGWRESEALTLRWDQIDREGQRARLAGTKSGLSWRELGGAASELLRELRRIEDSPYVFPGVKAGQPLADIKHVWYAVRQLAKLNDVRIHDLRHNFASVGAQGGTSLLVLGAVLGHRELSTTQKYAHLGERPTSRAADEISSRISSMLDGKKVAKDKQVVSLDSRKHGRTASGAGGRRFTSSRPD